MTVLRQLDPALKVLRQNSIINATDFWIGNTITFKKWHGSTFDVTVTP